MLDVPQNQHFPVLLRKGLQSPLQGLAQLFALQLLGRNLPPIGKVFRKGISRVVGLWLVDGLIQVA